MLSYQEFCNFLKESAGQPTVNGGLVIEIEGHRIEFKPENELGLYTFDEALNLEHDGWELLDGELWDAILEECKCKYIKSAGVYGLLIDDKVFLPTIDGKNSGGMYWAHYRKHWEGEQEYLDFNKTEIETASASADEKLQVRLARVETI